MKMTITKREYREKTAASSCFAVQHPMCSWAEPRLRHPINLAWHHQFQGSYPK